MDAQADLSCLWVRLLTLWHISSMKRFDVAKVMLTVCAYLVPHSDGYLIPVTVTCVSRHYMPPLERLFLFFTL